MRSRSQGLRAGPKCGLVRERAERELVRVQLPDTIAPAARRRATHSASRSGTRSRIFDAAVVGMPATSITSLTRDTPVNGSQQCQALLRRLLLPRWRNALYGIERHGSVSGGRRSSISESAAGRGRGSRGRPGGPSSVGCTPWAPAASRRRSSGTRLGSHADLRVSLRRLLRAVRGVPLALDEAVAAVPEMRRQEGHPRCFRGSTPSGCRATSPGTASAAAGIRCSQRSAEAPASTTS